MPRRLVRHLFAITLLLAPSCRSTEVKLLLGEDGEVGPVDALSYKISVSEFADGLHVQTTGEFIAREALTELPLDFDLSTPPRSVIGEQEKACRRDARLHVRCPLEAPAAKGSRVKLTWRHDVLWTDNGEEPRNTPFRRDGSNWTTIHWPNCARSWLALHDHPSDAATYAIDVTAPNAKVVFANGSLVEKRSASDSETLWRYALTTPIPSYTAFVGVTDALSKTVFAAGEGGVSVEVWAKPSRDPALIATIFADVPRAMAFLKRNFGEYRFGNTLQYIEATTGWGGAMEHAGAIAMDPDAFGNPEDARRKAFHELAHHWSGNSVRLKTWDDFWMSEAFAEYLAYRTIENLDGIPLSKRYWIRASNNAREGAVSHPLHVATGGDQDPTPATIVKRLFDAVPYTRGPLAVRAMEVRMGRAEFDPWLRGWFQARALKATDTEALRASLEEATDDSWEAFFQLFIYGDAIAPL